jgi:hypothetical protein
MRLAAEFLHQTLELSSGHCLTASQSSWIQWIQSILGRLWATCLPQDMIIQTTAWDMRETNLANESSIYDAEIDSAFMSID